MDFCNKYNLKLRVFNKDGNIIMSRNKDANGSKKNRKNLIFMMRNNHPYVIDHKYINKKSKNEKKEFIYNSDLQTEFKKLLDNGQEPINIQINNKTTDENFISSYEFDNIIYHTNEEYEKCKNILSLFGLEDKAHPNIKLSNIYRIIEPLYLKDNINSFWDGSNNYVKGGFIYDDGEKYYPEDVVTIDKNKCYSYILRNLNFLVVVDDIKTSEIYEISDFKKIIPHHLYVVETETSNIFITENNIYTGEHLLYAISQGITDFKIIQGLKTSKVENYYKQMIDDIYKLCDPKDAKEIINRMIGNFAHASGKVKDFVSNINICNRDETECTSGYKLKIDDTYNLLYDTEQKTNTFTRQPIRIQIIDMARVEIYKKMKQLNLRSENIKQIYCDAITYKPEKNTYLETNNDFEGWNYTDKKIIKKCIKFNKPVVKFDHNFISKEKDIIDINENNYIYGDAGCGKSHIIINNIIPKLDDYLILTPSYATMKEYKKQNFNCCVIQKYTLSNTTPTEQNIIIDECGMVDYQGLLLIYNLSKLNRCITMMGDFSQLLSFGSMRQLDNSQYINSVFNNIIENKNNFRNNFTKEYYNKLRSSEDKQYLLNEIVKYTSKKRDKPIEEYNFVSYLINTRDEINNKILEKMNKNKYDIGVRCISITNDLIKKYDIYNNFEYTIKDNEDDLISFNETDVKITYKEYDKNFRPAYCKTLRAVQGQTLNNYVWCNYDADNKFINGRRAYTLISRLKEQKNINYIPQNIKVKCNGISQYLGIKTKRTKNNNILQASGKNILSFGI
jgi:hypothetical protein